MTLEMHRKLLGWSLHQKQPVNWGKRPESTILELWNLIFCPFFSFLRFSLMPIVGTFDGVLQVPQALFTFLHSFINRSNGTETSVTTQCQALHTCKNSMEKSQMDGSSRQQP